MHFFGAKAFLMLAIVITKIVYLGFLASYASKVALIMWMSRVLSKLWLSTVFCVVPCLALGLISGLVLGTKSISNSGSLSILFIIKKLVFLVILCGMFKLLLGLGQCSI